MTRERTHRKCRCCKEFFVPDYRNAAHQKFCTKPGCRTASKAASQRRWLSKKANRGYFRGEDNVKRVQEWREAHPRYWQRQKPRTQANQAPEPEPVKPEQRSCNVPPRDLRTLQDLYLVQDPAFVGLISMITGSTLQEDIAATGRKLILRGWNILGLKTRDADQRASTITTSHDSQTHPPPGPAPPSAAEL